MVEAVHPIYNSIWDSPGAVAILLQPGHDLENKDMKRYQKLERFTSYHYTRFVCLGGFPYTNIFCKLGESESNILISWDFPVRSASVGFPWFFSRNWGKLLESKHFWQARTTGMIWCGCKGDMFLRKSVTKFSVFGWCQQKISRWTPTNLSPTLHLVSWMIKWLGFLKKPHLGWGQNGNK